MFFLSTSSFLQAKGGLENLLEGPEIRPKVRMARAANKTRKLRMVEEVMKENPQDRFIPLLRTYYEKKIAVLQEISHLPSSPTSSSSSFNPLNDFKERYDFARDSLKAIKKRLSPKSKQALKPFFGTRPPENEPFHQDFTITVNPNKDEADYVKKLTEKGRALLAEVLEREDVEEIH